MSSLGSDLTTSTTALLAALMICLTLVGCSHLRLGWRPEPIERAGEREFVQIMSGR